MDEGAPRRSIRLVALTGGIGAGKSTVARMLEGMGATVISADRVARDIVDPRSERGASVLRDIVTHLGDGVLRPDGTLDREGVSKLVFHDDDLRRRFNDIVHPAIRDATAELLAPDRRRTGELVVHEIPLLTADTPTLPWTYDLVVTVEAGEEERVKRLVADRGYSQHHAAARIAAQGSEAGRLAIADVVIRTDGSMDDTRRSVDALWARVGASGGPTDAADGGKISDS